MWWWRSAEICPISSRWWLQFSTVSCTCLLYHWINWTLLYLIPCRNRQGFLPHSVYYRIASRQISHSTLILCSLKFVGEKARLSLPILRRHMCTGGIAQLILILHTSAISFTPRPFLASRGKSNKLEAPWPLDPVWMLWRREKVLHLWEIETQFLVGPEIYLMSQN